MKRNLLILCVVTATLAGGASAAHAISATLGFARGDGPDAGLDARPDLTEFIEMLQSSDEAFAQTLVELYLVASADTLISNADGTLAGRPVFRIQTPAGIDPFAFRGLQGTLEIQKIWSLVAEELAGGGLRRETLAALLGPDDPRLGPKTPVPEPATAGMLLLGLLGLARRRA